MRAQSSGDSYFPRPTFDGQWIGIEVSEQIKALPEPRKLTVSNAFIGMDPVPGQVKELQLKLMLGNNIESLSAKEGQILELPIGAAVVQAQYGCYLSTSKKHIELVDNITGLDHDNTKIPLLAFQHTTVLGFCYFLDHVNNNIFFSTGNGTRLFPGYLDSLVINNTTKHIGPYINDPNKITTIEIDRAFSIIHGHLIYGHVLIEIIPKLFLVKYAYKKGFKFPIILPNKTPNWLINAINDITPEVEIFYFDHTTEAVKPRLLLTFPSSIPNIPYSQLWLHPAITTAYYDLCEAKHANAKNRRIFICRPKGHRSQRILTNELELGEIAKAYGFELIEPSTLNGIKEQAKLFYSSSHVIGEYTSALHNTVFSPRGTRVLCINKLGNIVQTAIAETRDHQLKFLMPVGGYVEHDSKKKFEVDPEEFRKELESLIK